MSLPQAAGYPVASIQSCSQFQRTHRFILETWEAMYRIMVLKHIEHNSAIVLQELMERMMSLPKDNFRHAFNYHLQSQSQV